MRKQVLFGAALLALGTAVVSCSKDEVVVDNTPGVETPVAEGEQEIILQVANTGDELTSRAGRPLYSAEAKQNIDNVFIMIVNNDGTVVKTNQINDWMNVSEDYATNGHGKEYTWKIPAAEALGEGTYKVYAIGYSNSSDYIYGTDQIAKYVENMEKSSASFEKFVATLKSIAAEEFFAGEIEQIGVDENGEFKLEANNSNTNVLTLHRQVTGVTGYFINVPTSSAAERGKIMTALSEKATNSANNIATYNKAIANYKLRLVASNCSDQVVAAGFNHKFTTTGEDVKYIVNGLQSGSFSSNITAGAKFSGESDNSRYIVYEISLGDWFPNGDVNNDGILGEADANAGVNNWGKPSTMGDQSVGFQPGSVFGSSFLIPFLKKAGTKTLELQLWGKAVSVSGTGETDYEISEGISDEILRSWNINLASDDDQLGSTSVNGNFVWTLSSPDYEPIQIEGTTMAEERTSYSLVRNHLYSVGEKGTDEWDPDTDEPEDLSKGQNLILRVNDNWELIHKMEVE